MKELNKLKNVDIYLLDQALKGRIPTKGQLLDAGCGKGRNFGWLAAQGLNIYGFDPDPNAIQLLRAEYPSHEDRLSVHRIESFKSKEAFDFIICNAVLHFAENHSAFNQQFACLVKLLNPSGILFIRMASDIGINVQIDEHGRCNLPDLTTRYLLRQNDIVRLCNEYDLTLLEPVKSAWVNGERSMATVVFTKPV